MPRIVTMIASATEIVCALGFEKDLVARSHECDFPPSVTKLPVCTAPKFDVHGSSLEIDQRVKSLLAEASSIYHVDAAMLEQLEADVIVTQSHCEVCAVSDKDVEHALESSRGKRMPKIVSLSPNNLADVWQSIRNVAAALEVRSQGETLVHHLQDRVRAIEDHKPPMGERPTVACLEWLNPLMAAGNWVPELVELAGGRNLFGQAGKHSPWMSLEQLHQHDPMYIIGMPCGYGLETTRIEMNNNLRPLVTWKDLQAVRNGHVYAADGNQYFNRPGPRLVESLEILAEILHPDRFSFGHAGEGWERFE